MSSVCWVIHADGELLPVLGGCIVLAVMFSQVRCEFAVSRVVVNGLLSFALLCAACSSAVIRSTSRCWLDRSEYLIVELLRMIVLRAEFIIVDVGVSTH